MGHWDRVIAYPAKTGIVSRIGCRPIPAAAIRDVQEPVFRHAQIDYNYSNPDDASQSAIDEALSRLGSIGDLVSGVPETLASESYLGLSDIVTENYDTPGILLDYTQGGAYAGLDRFGRVVDQVWSQAGQINPLDEYQYAYDPVGNETSRINATDQTPPTAGQLDQTVGYYNTNRLWYNYQGQNFQNVYAYDSSGNQILSGPATATPPTGRSTPRTSCSSSAAAATTRGAAQYDLAGNQISLEQNGNSVAVETEKYDAWNRLVGVYDASGNPIETYSYDGTGRRITVSRLRQRRHPSVDHRLLPQRPAGDPDRHRLRRRRVHVRLSVHLVAALR